MMTKYLVLLACCLAALTACNNQQTKTNDEFSPAIATDTMKMEQEDIKPLTSEEETDSVKSETASIVPLTVIVDHLKSPNAPIEMSIYGPDNKFPAKDDQLKKYRFKPKNGKLVAKINDLQYGSLALALYQDVDSDGEIDKNGLGIPTEPYAFSNNVRPVVKAPTFEQCKFVYDSVDNTVSIVMRK